MASLIYGISASLDGFIVDENGNFDWTEISDDAHTFFYDLQGSVGTSLYVGIDLTLNATQRFEDGSVVID